MLEKPRILSLFPNSFNINSIKHEHSCKILYLFSAAKLSDSGMYTCTLMDEHGDEMSSKSFRVTVLRTSK